MLQQTPEGAHEDPAEDIEDPYPGDEDSHAPVPDNEDIVDNNGLLLNQQPMCDTLAVPRIAQK